MDLTDYRNSDDLSLAEAGSTVVLQQPEPTSVDGVPHGGWIAARERDRSNRTSPYTPSAAMFTEDNEHRWIEATYDEGRECISTYLVELVLPNSFDTFEAAINRRQNSARLGDKEKVDRTLQTAASRMDSDSRARRVHGTAAYVAHAEMEKAFAETDDACTGASVHTLEDCVVALNDGHGRLQVYLAADASTIS